MTELLVARLVLAIMVSPLIVTAIFDKEE